MAHSFAGRQCVGRLTVRAVDVQDRQRLVQHLLAGRAGHCHLRQGWVLFAAPRQVRANPEPQFSSERIPQIEHRIANDFDAIGITQ